MPYLTFVRWWIVDFEIEFSKYYLMMAILGEETSGYQNSSPYLVERRREDRYRTQNVLECESIH